MPSAASPRDRLVALLGLVGLYAACLFVATYPAGTTLASRLAVAEVSDPLQHLWQMRWFRARLLDGTSPLFCPSIQWPTGSPLGLYSPLQLQSLFYIGIRTFTKNDVLIYNLILTSELLFTGLGTFALAFELTRSRGGSTLAGLLAMLSGPMLFNALVGGTELLALGCFPLFLRAWIRLVDAPSPRRLAAAVGLYLLVALSAAYYGVIAVVPATIHVAIRAFGRGPGGFVAFCRSRIGWLLGFGLLSAITVPLLFPAQIWAVVHGVTLARSRFHFEQFGTTIWHYIVPTPSNFLANLLMPRFWSTPGFLDRPNVYLGAVTLALTVYAGVRRVPMRHAATIWASLGCLVLLSLGASTTVGDLKAPLPASWLWDHCPPFRMLRVPARFGYFASVCASVLAGAAAGQILDGLKNPLRKRLRLAALIALSVADLAFVPYGTTAFRPEPACYAAILKSRPGSAFCEVHPSFPYIPYESQITYWQSLHLGRTSAGNPGVANSRLEQTSLIASPFHYSLIGNPGYLSGADHPAFDIVSNCKFSDYAWLYLAANRFDFVVLHRWTFDGSPPPATISRVRERLADAVVFEDSATSVIDRTKMKPPTAPAAICTAGWLDRVVDRGGYTSLASRDARMAIYNPDPDRPLTLRVRASSNRKPRTVRVIADGREIGIWRVVPDRSETFVSSAFRLPVGLLEIRLESDGESPRLGAEGPATPFSLRVSGVDLGWEGDPARPTLR